MMPVPIIGLKPARPGRRPAGVPGLRPGHLAGPLVSGPHPHPHHRLRRRLAHGVLPGQLLRVRGRQEAARGRGRRAAASSAVQGAQVSAGVLLLQLRAAITVRSVLEGLLCIFHRRGPTQNALQILGNSRIPNLTRLIWILELPTECLTLRYQRA